MTPEQQRIKIEPETFLVDDKVWTRHTPGDPMPCDGEAVLDIIYYDQSVNTSWEAESINWDFEGMIGWRYADDKVKTPRTDAIIAADTGDSGFIAELTKLSCSLEEENADLKEALEKAKEFVQSWGKLVDAHYSLQNQCMTKIQKALAP